VQPRGGQAQIRGNIIVDTNSILVIFWQRGRFHNHVIFSPLQESQPSDGTKTDDTEESAKYALRQAKLGRELQELNKMLSKKQELACQMAVNEAGMESMKKQYEVCRARVLKSWYV
jgi:hypothetical protein